ncbi:helix-turn-helix domain-containing protein [Myceligenerans halotolerans]
MLEEEQRARLRAVVSKGVSPARAVMRARALLALDESGGTVPVRAEVAARLEVSIDFLAKLAARWVEVGDVDAVIGRKKRARPPVEPKVTGEVEARVIALACSAPPAGYARWSLRLLEKHVVLLEGVPDLDHSTIGRVLKRGRSSRT